LTLNEHSLWKWSLNWGEIMPNIIVGSCPMTPDDIFLLRRKANVSALLSLQHDEGLNYWNIDYPAMVQAAQDLKMVMIRCPIRDFDIPDMRRNLPHAVSTLNHLLHSHHRTYVHCTAGLGRSPLIVLGDLIWIANYHKEDAIRLILRGRPGAVPAWEAFHGACDDLENRYSDEIEMLAYRLYESGQNNDPLMDWDQAKSDIFNKELLRVSNEHVKQ